MNSRTPKMTDRICGAADALLRAIESDDGLNATVDVWVGEHPDERESLCPSAFTAGEYVAAMTMLVRLGAIDRELVEQLQQRAEE